MGEPACVRGKGKRQLTSRLEGIQKKIQRCRREKKKKGFSTDPRNTGEKSHSSESNVNGCNRPYMRKPVLSLSISGRGLQSNGFLNPAGEGEQPAKDMGALAVNRKA